LYVCVKFLPFNERPSFLCHQIRFNCCRLFSTNECPIRYAGVGAAEKYESLKTAELYVAASNKCFATTEVKNGEGGLVAVRFYESRASRFLVVSDTNTSRKGAEDEGGGQPQ
jgi:hypothetical protein